MSASGRRHLVIIDIVAASMLVVVWVVEAARLDHGGPARQAGVVVLAVGASAPFAFRRLAPLTVFVVMSSCFAVALLLGTASTGVGSALAAYTILVARSRRVGAAVVVTGYALIVLAHATADGATLTDLFFNAITFAMVIAIAELMRTRAAYSAIHADRMAHLEAERIAVAHRAVDDERLRIARELHDVVAHSITSIAVQSSVGRERLHTEPAVTEQALRAIESSSRTALAEMRRILGVLRPRGDEHDASLSPTPGLDRIGDLVEKANGSGVTATLSIDGARPVAVAPGVELCAYRIVQEALTNVVKHAAGAHADVTIRWHVDSVAIDVADDGHGHALFARLSDSNTGGHGLLGMSERVALFGGELSAGARPNGGFAIHAIVPLEPSRVQRPLAPAETSPTDPVAAP